MHLGFGKTEVRVASVNAKLDSLIDRIDLIDIDRRLTRLETRQSSATQ